MLECASVVNQTQDDGFHEIQLNGKQLVFVFVAATLLSVVIFLCGVLVGRGVQRERIVLAQTDARTPQALSVPGLDPAKPVVPPTAPTGADPTRAAAPAAKDSSTAAASSADSGRAQTQTQTRIQANPKTTNPPAATADARSAEADALSKPTATTGDVPQSGWVVQVASVDDRQEAHTLAKRLSDKGYSTFVLESGANRFRVRVGSFKSKGDADAAAARLSKEERIVPWVTR
jgi:cell division septation protein DedD